MVDIFSQGSSVVSFCVFFGIFFLVGFFFFLWLDFKRLGRWAELPLILKGRGYDQECKSSVFFAYSHCICAFKACLCRTWNIDFFLYWLFLCVFQTYNYVYIKVFFQILINFVFLMKKKQISAEILFVF